MREASAPPVAPLSPEEEAQRAEAAEAAFVKEQNQKKMALVTVAVCGALGVIGLAMEPLLFIVTALLAVPVVSALRRFTVSFSTRLGQREVVAGIQLGLAGVVAAGVLFGLVPRWEQSGHDYVVSLSDIVQTGTQSGDDVDVESAETPPPASEEAVKPEPVTEEEGEVAEKAEEEGEVAEKAEEEEVSAVEKAKQGVSDALSSGRETLEAGRGKIGQ